MFSNPLFFFEQFLKNIYHLEQKQLKSKFNLMFKSVLYLIIFYIYWNSIQFHFFNQHSSQSFEKKNRRRFFSVDLCRNVIPLLKFRKIHLYIFFRQLTTPIGKIRFNSTKTLKCEWTLSYI